jgi:hypothetical protein
MGWDVAGSYFEACNCDAICPCRVVGDKPGSRATYGICQFALSWLVSSGHADDVALDGFAVVLAGWYDEEEPSSPWSVNLYVDDRATDEQHEVLADIFLGRIAGGTMQNYGRAIGTTHRVRRAHIELSHEPRRWRIKASTYVSVAASRPVESEAPIACGIPGLDRPGQEVVSDELRVTDAPLQWDVRERCGFATDFHYSG